MALNTKLSNVSVSTEADAFAVLFNAGYLRIYDGDQPATADAPLTTQVLLAELRFPNPAFGSAASGVITANAIDPVNAGASGLASWFRCTQSDGATVLMDGSVGLALCNLILDSVALQLGAEVSINSFQHTVTK
jgi:hypothetical protein